MSITLALLLLAADAAVKVAPLDAYVAAPDDSYRWEKRAEETILGVECHELKMVSQEWKSIPWKHLITIARPTNLATEDQAILLIGGSSWREEYDLPPNPKKLSRTRQDIAFIANAAKMMVVAVEHIPFQPMLNGRKEDEIIAYTFAQYLKTGDETWPLLLPMTKAAVRTMDTAQDYIEQTWKHRPESFVVTGASKRGWTTWLTAAADPRVKAIAPMVIDMLNMDKQMDLQVKTFGGYSEQIEDYTELNLQKSLSTPEGKKLQAIVDPFAYRDRYVMPKLIVLGTNDRYWPVDALNIYWDHLNGEKHILYVPNKGHRIDDPVRVVGTITAMALHAAGKLPFPKLQWNLEEAASGLELSLNSDMKPKQVSVWTAAALTRDFREAPWKSQPMENSGEGWRAQLPRPKEGYAAMFGEAVYEVDGHRFFLSTNLRVIGTAEGN